MSIDRTRAVVRALALAALMASPSTAQVVIPDAVTCRSCKLTLELVRTVGDQPGAELLELSGLRSAAVAGDGSVWLPNGQILSILQVFDDQGGLELFERKGDGPDEFKEAHVVGCYPDGRLVFAGDGRRLHTVDPGTRHISKSPPTVMGTRYVESIVALSAEEVWVSAPSRDPDYLGVPILSINPESGEVIGAYGKTGPNHYDRLVERHTTRHFSRFPRGTRILSAHRFEYVLDTHARDGTLLQRYMRDAPWFRPQTDQAVNVVMGAAQPIDDRYVFVAVLVRNEEFHWVPGRPEAPGPDIPRAKQWDTVMEVVDLQQREVVYREKVDDAVASVACPSGELVMSEFVGDTEIRAFYRIQFQGGQSW